jgi:hypothetical protein
MVSEFVDIKRLEHIERVVVLQDHRDKLISIDRFQVCSSHDGVNVNDGYRTCATTPPCKGSAAPGNLEPSTDHMFSICGLFPWVLKPPHAVAGLTDTK